MRDKDRAPRTDITRRFTDTLHGLYQDRAVPEEVLAESRRSWVNVVHTAIGAARHPIVDAMVSVHGGSGAEGLPFLARSERSDVYGIALVTGTAAHIEDFDDTHLATVIHPGAACLGAALAIGGRHGSSGAEVLHAFALGIEAQLRVGVALTPSHYDEGWHITGTCGVIGAAVTAGLLLGLDRPGLARAVGLAVSQTVGHREGFGSSVKPFNAGKAGANGVLAALLAEQELTSPTTALEGRQGLFAVFSPAADPEDVLRDIGVRWESCDNAYKPYPCGIVSHPAIDAAVALAPRLQGRDVVSADVLCHPLVVELTGNPQPENGLRAKFSTVHGVAAGLLDATVGLPQYADARVTATDVRDLRAATTLSPDPDCARDEATVRVRLSDGTELVEHVRHARGSNARPLTDEELAAKSLALTGPVLGERAGDMLESAWGLDRSPTLADHFAPARVEGATA
ncbi:MmgE/PrpD family protein [Nocardiopsis sp. MG754419]|uniref:MmgE/PrpD family protein n=1 Tax=Nocardiopsis sp. MG754419 TaxID=2259865 RepID=UPI001BADA57D|nr:MmgE/PrpD family protein [Nocardiopsis sp. MG754419]